MSRVYKNYILKINELLICGVALFSIFSSGVSAGILADKFKDGGIVFEFSDNGAEAICEQSSKKVIDGQAWACRFDGISPKQVLKNVMEARGKVEVDCQLFVQLASLFLSGLEDEKSFNLGVGKGAPVGENQVYVSFEDINLYDNLQNSTFSNKGQWVVKDGDEWVGLTRDGIQGFSLDEWRRDLVDGLIKETECSDVKSNASARIVENIANSIVRCKIQLAFEKAGNDIEAPRKSGLLKTIILN